MVRATGFLLVFHAALGAAGILVLLKLSPPLLGVAIGGWAVLYVGLLGAAAWLTGRDDILNLWWFLVPLSVCQVLPDVMLVNELRTLVFPDLGGARWQGVPLFMAGLWVMPLLLVVWAADVAQRHAGAWSWLVAPLAALAVFGGAEWFARPFNIWFARNVTMVEGVAIYVLVAEAVLGLVTWAAWCLVQRRNPFAKALVAALVSVSYTAALFGAWWAVEKGLS